MEERRRRDRRKETEEETERGIRIGTKKMRLGGGGYYLKNFYRSGWRDIKKG